MRQVGVDACRYSGHHCDSMTLTKPWRTLEVSAQPPGGTRLDLWLAKQVPEISRNQAKSLIEDHNILVDGKPSKKGRTLMGGETIEVITDPGSHDWIAVADPGPNLSIVHEDAHLIVVEKPSGMPSVPLVHDATGALANAIVGRFPECAPIQRRPGDGGLIHRLDNETSGLMIAARTAQCFDRLVRMQKDGQIEKRYTAAALAKNGRPPATIEIPLEDRPVRTQISTLRRIGDLLLLEAVIHAGARHQIRKHLSQAGFPIAGDKLYGGPEIEGLDRLFLHASGLTFEHPMDTGIIELNLGLPPDLESILT